MPLVGDPDPWSLSSVTARSFDLNTIQQQLCNHLQQQDPSWQAGTWDLLAHGEANLIYRWIPVDPDDEASPRLIRVAVNSPNQRFQGDFRQVTQLEAAILDYLKGSGIGHTLYATHLDLRDGFPYSYLVTNFLPGRSLNYSRDDLKRCAGTLARLHRLALVTPESLDRLSQMIPQIPQPLSQFYQEAQTYAQPYLESSTAEPELVLMIQDVLAAAATRLEREAWLTTYPYRCLVHGDHTYENWLITPQQAYLIDWEWAEIGSPAGDLGHFLSPVTVRRFRGYQLPPEDRDYFLACYDQALEDRDLAERIRYHMAAFGPFPALRSLCWTAGYWITSARWYEHLQDQSPSALDRIDRWHESRRQFPQMWQEVMDWFKSF